MDSVPPTRKQTEQALLPIARLDRSGSGWSWLRGILLLLVGLPILVVDVIIIGICTSGFIVLQSVLVVRLYGTVDFVTPMGLLELCIIPFLFGVSPIVSLLRDTAGSYDASVFMVMVCLAASALCCLLVSRRQNANRAGE